MLLRDITPDILFSRAALLSDGVVLVTLPPGAADADLAGRFGLAPPYGTVAVHTAGGPGRIAAMRLPGGGGGLHGAGDVVFGADVTELAEDMDGASRRRLLGFMLGFCRRAFAIGADIDFAGSCLRLAEMCAIDVGPVTPVAWASPSYMVVSGMVRPAGADLYVLGASRVRISAGPALTEPGRPSGGACLIEPVGAGDRVLALGDDLLIWTVQEADGPLSDVMQPFGLEPEYGALRAQCLRALAPLGGALAPLVREVQLLAPAAASRHDDVSSALGAALEVALPDGEGGLFLRGWIRDPMHLVAGAEIRTPLGAVEIDPDHLHRMRRPDVAGRYSRAAFHDDELRSGFVAHVRDPSNGLCAQPVLAFRLLSGAVIEVQAPLRHVPFAAARDAVLGCVPPEEVTPRMMDTCLAPVAAALHRQAIAGRGAVDVVRIGDQPQGAPVSVIIPLYRNLEFLRFQAAAFAADAGCRAAELIYVLDSPEQRAEVEHMLRGLHGVHRLGFTLAVMPGNCGYAAANNAAAALASGRHLLLLNSDVVPVRPGWLAAMQAALEAPGVGAVGPKLLFDDGSIQHAGLFFERDADGAWFNAHYHKGMPRHWPAALRARRVPGVTGAALLVRRPLFEAVGGICEDYIIGDYEDSDFCLRLRETGAEIAYVPEAELYHFERRSIRLHAGYTRTVAAQYNRKLHHGRWDSAMAALMATPAFQRTLPEAA
jgi:GT2 family glycosyltransferase